jgi:ABC-type uncharacterized transport system permease subunit
METQIGLPNFIFMVILALAILTGIIIALKAVTLWYLRINDRITLLERNNELLSKLVKHFTGEDTEALYQPKRGLFIDKVPEKKTM